MNAISTNLTELAEFLPASTGDYNPNGRLIISAVRKSAPKPERPSIDTTVKSASVSKIVAFDTLTIDVYPTAEFATKHGLDVNSPVTIYTSDEDDRLVLRWDLQTEYLMDELLSMNEIVSIFGSYDGAFTNPGLVLDYLSKQL